MFSWGWLPPMGSIQAGFMEVFEVGLYGLAAPLPQTLPDVLVREPASEDPTGT